MIVLDQLSDTQRKVLRELARAPNYTDPMGGNGRAPMLSACHALVRKGVLYSHRTGHFGVLSEYRGLADEALATWREIRKQAKEQSDGTR